MTREQSRAARGLLGWTQDDLAKKSRVSVTTIRNFERGASQPIAVTLEAMQRALEAGGVNFIAENGGGLGVRLKLKSSERQRGA